MIDFHRGFDENDIKDFWLTEDAEKIMGGPPYLSYSNLFASIGDIVDITSVGDYQGDYLVVLRSPETGRFGFLVVGYGSCSGCDNLESARDDGPRAVKDLRNAIASSVLWFSSAKDLALYMIQEKDWRGSFMGEHVDKIVHFILGFARKNGVDFRPEAP